MGAFFFERWTIFFSQRHQLRNIGFVKLSNMGNSRIGIIHPLPHLAPERREPLLLDRAPLGKIDAFRHRLLGFFRGRLGGVSELLEMLDVGFQVFESNPPAPLASLYPRKVNAQILGYLPYRGRGRRRKAASGFVAVFACKRLSCCPNRRLWRRNSRPSLAQLIPLFLRRLLPGALFSKRNQHLS